MFIKSDLFSKGHPVSGQPSLSSVLENHKRATLNKIECISDLDQMTDAFLQRLVKDSVVEPLAILFDKKTRKLRTEGLDGSVIPENSMAGRMRRSGLFSDAELFGEGGNKKQVARLSIPFTGDRTLLQYAPNPCGLNFPKGEVNGNTIQFDVILWGSPDDAQRVPAEIQKNCELMATFAAAINKQVKEFNESLPAHIKAAFTAKLEKLTEQHSIFDDLDIPEEPEAPDSPSRPVSTQPKKGKARARQVIQFIETMYVQQLNQTNNNLGDVNNAIQAD
jgi:hypothetical protein